MFNRKLICLILVVVGLVAATLTQAQNPITDGRLNSYDAAAPIVIYPDGAGGLDIYLVDPATGGGFLTLRVPASTLAVEDVYLLARNESGTVNVFKEGNEYVIMGIAPNLETYVFRITDPTTNAGFNAYTLHYPVYTTAEELGVPVEEVTTTVEEAAPAVEAEPEVEATAEPEAPVAEPTVEPTPAPPADSSRRAL